MKLEDAMRKEYSVSKLLWLLVIVIDIAAVVLSLRAIWVMPSAVTTFAWLIAAPLVCALLRKFAGDHYGRAEERRRALVRVDGWGQSLDPAESLLLSSETTGTPSWDPSPIASYYSSPRAAGDARVAHIVEQAAFFTARHARAAAAVCWLVVLAGVGIAVTVMWFATRTGGLDARNAGDAAAALLAFAAAGDFIVLALSYSELAATARATVGACGRLLRSTPVKSPELAAVVGTYDAVLAKSPPIPGVIYRLHRQRLEAEWHEFEVQPAGGSTR
jgi:hypothetical protein